MAAKPEASESSTSGASSAGAGPMFEQSLAQLETLVTQLESGELPLNEALACFEHGVRLTRECQSALSAAQQKVQLLLQRGEGVVLEDFEPIAAGDLNPAE
jgi:exodeoxyribonuclease VII small subunit